MGSEERRPRYIIVADTLRTMITEGLRWKAGMRIPAERELTEEMGISRNTLRQALSVLESEGYLFSEVGRGTFVNSPSHWGSGAKTRKSKLIGLIVTDIKFDFGKRLVQGAEEYLHDRGFSLILCQDMRDLDRTDKYLGMLLENDVKGVILDPVLSGNYEVDNARIVARLKSEGVPVVFVDRWVPRLDLPCVRTNNEEISFKAADYLIKAGHRRIAVIRGKEWMFERRFEGVAAAAAENGLPPDGLVDITVDSHDNVAYDTQMLEEVLSSSERGSAAIALSEYYGKVAYRAMEDMGIRVPEDMAFITFDHPDESSFKDGQMTYIEQPLARLGRVSAQFIIDLIEGRPVDPRGKVIKSRLVIGESTKR
jgi:GntR family transcriptional regulator, arabinose operon transcriptional repressor